MLILSKAWATQHTPPVSAGALTFINTDLAIHEHIVDADRILVRRVERGFVDHLRGIEDRDVCEHSFLDQCSIT